jgi:hypothetical protein
MTRRIVGPDRPDGGVAQLGEHLLCKQGVIGSIPIVSTRGVSTVGTLPNGMSRSVMGWSTVSWKSRVRCDRLMERKRFCRLVVPFAFLAWNAVSPLGWLMFF